jgi:hypothetical protein
MFLRRACTLLPGAERRAGPTRARVILFRLSIADGHFDYHSPIDHERSPIDHERSQDDDNLELTLALERARKSKVRPPARPPARAARGARREW